MDAVVARGTRGTCFIEGDVCEGAWFARQGSGSAFRAVVTYGADIPSAAICWCAGRGISRAVVASRAVSLGRVHSGIWAELSWFTCLAFRHIS